MLKFVHHVLYVVASRDDFVAYMEKNFGLKPDKVEDREGRSKDALYRVGQTEVRVREPAPGSGSSFAKFLEKNGPGLHHLGWGVEEDVPQLVQELRAKGNTLTGESGFYPDYYGYPTISIDPKDSLGVEFELVEDRK